MKPFLMILCCGSALLFAQQQGKNPGGNVPPSDKGPRDKGKISQPPPDSEPVVFGDGSIKVHSHYRSGLKFAIGKGSSVDVTNTTDVYVRVPVSITSGGAITMSASTLIPQTDATQVTIGLQRFANNAWDNSGAITMNRMANGKEWTMTVTPGAANVQAPVGLQTKSGQQQADFEINGALSARVRIGQVTVRSANGTEKTVPLGTGCSSVMIAQTGQGPDASTDPCSGKIVPSRVVPQFTVMQGLVALDLSGVLPVITRTTTGKPGSTTPSQQ